MNEKRTNKKASSKEQAMISLACKVAEMSECSHRHGAVIVKGGSVLALGFNKNKGDTESVHAEIDAMARCKYSRLRGAIVYVARINNKSETRLSRPCDQCYTTLESAGVKKVVFT